MIKWTLIVLAGVVFTACVVAGIGWMLPRGHRASKTVVLRSEPAVVFAVITDFAAAPSWRPELKRVEMLPTDHGRTVFKEVSSDGAVTFRVEQMTSPSRLVTRIADASLPFGGTWTFDVAPENGGTALTITEDGEVYNPLFRFMSRFVFSPAATIERYQENLRRRLAR